MNSWVLGLHLLSAHVSPGYETFTPGVYVMQEGGGITAGIFRNSERRWSGYGGYTWQGETFALSAGVVAGYRASPVLPFIVPSAKFGPVRLSLAAKPPRLGHSLALHLSFERNFRAF